MSRRIEWPPGSGRVAEWDDHEAASVREWATLCEQGKMSKHELSVAVSVLHDVKMTGGRMLTDEEAGTAPPVDLSGTALPLPDAIRDRLRLVEEPVESVDDPPENGATTLFELPESEEPPPEPPPEPPTEDERAEGLKAGRAARDEAMRRVDTAADPNWKDEADAAIDKLALTREELTSDDVWRFLGWQPTEPRAMGPRMRIAARRGVIEKIPGKYKQADRGINHARPQQVWRSLVYRRPA